MCLGVRLTSFRSSLHELAKYFQVTYSKCRDILTSLYNISNTALQPVNADLGVIFDSKCSLSLSLSSHINFLSQTQILTKLNYRHLHLLQLRQNSFEENLVCFSCVRIKQCSVIIPTTVLMERRSRLIIRGSSLLSQNCLVI